MPAEPPNHLFIGADNADLVEYEKVLPALEHHEIAHVENIIPEAEAMEKPQPPANSTTLEQDESGNTPRYIYRVEYADNTGTVIAIKKGTTPPVHSSNQGHGAHIFELIKRVKVFAKAKDSEEKTKQGNDPVARKREDNTESKPTVTAKELSKPGALKDEKSDPEDDGLKNFDISPESNTTWSLRILSEYLINALRAVVGYYPGLQLLSRTIEFDEPYKELIHHMEDLENYKYNQPRDHSPEYQAICNEHIDELIAYLRQKFDEKLKEEYERHERDPPVCTFSYLWLIFRPGDEVYWNWGSSPNLTSSYIVEKVTGGVSADTQATPLKIILWRVFYNGGVMGRRRFSHTVQPFEGEKPILELKAYPARFYRDDPKEICGLPRKDQFTKNGKAYFQLCRSKGHYRMFRGRPVVQGQQKAMVQGRVVVDLDQYCQDEDVKAVKPVVVDSSNQIGGNGGDTTARTGCRCTNCGNKPGEMKGRDWAKYENVSPADPPPTDDDLFYRLCHCLVPAYLLKDRKWEHVHVSDLHDVPFNENLLDSLVLPSEVKNVVKALTWNSARKTQDSFSADFIEGKGNGQILLLHGAPGVGKTATAECVAELLKRPLIALTCGDLGTNAKDVESKLRKYMLMGEVWNAVVLLDEADVYLESRQRGEVKRNALVSVFLRELERYQGIMFLTTNRVGTFDDAFLSRVHVGLLYRGLTDNDREKIWLKHFERLEAEKREPAVSVHTDAEDYVTGNWKPNGKLQDDLLRIQWNGREIRNAFQTALALASYAGNGTKKPGEKLRSVVLRAEHIQNVVRMSEQFKIFVNHTKRGDEESRANSEHLRVSSAGVAGKETSFGYASPTRSSM